LKALILFQSFLTYTLIKSANESGIFKQNTKLILMTIHIQ